MSHHEKIKQFYDEAIYRKLHGFIYENYRVEFAWDTLRSILQYKHPKNVLEIGCGIGEISYRISSRQPGTTVIGFDLSKKSIDVASELFINENLRFIRADNITDIEFGGKKFDIIFLMDVYEHIPVDYRSRLHLFIKQHISENGVLFISCPTPQYLDYLRKNNPKEIQPVDENITFDELLVLSRDTNLRLTNYKEVGVWRTSDYFHATFTSQVSMQELGGQTVIPGEQGIVLKKELKKRFLKIINKKANKNHFQKDIYERKELIRKMLGKEILTKVESYRIQ